MDADEAMERVRAARRLEGALFSQQQKARRQLIAAVKAARAAGVSQADLARATQTHRNTIANWCGEDGQ